MIRVVGAACMAAGSAAFGFAMAAASRREEEQLRLLVRSLEFMSCELSYRLTPLCGLCREAAALGRGAVPDFFLCLARMIEEQREPDVEGCVRRIMEQEECSAELRRLLTELGTTLGRFDLPGQLRGLEAAIASAGESLRRVREGAPERRRSYQTLGLCTGAAMAILLL